MLPEELEKKFYAVQKDCVLPSTYSWQSYPKTFLRDFSQYALLSPVCYGEAPSIKLFDLQSGQVHKQDLYHSNLSAAQVLDSSKVVALFDGNSHYIVQMLSAQDLSLIQEYRIQKDYLTKKFDILVFDCVKIFCVTAKDSFSTQLWFFDFQLKLILWQRLGKTIETVHKLNDTGKVWAQSDNSKGPDSQIQITVIDVLTRNTYYYLLPKQASWCNIDVLWEYSPNHFYLKGYQLFPKACHLITELSLDPASGIIQMKPIHQDLRKWVQSQPEQIYKVNVAGNYLIIIRRPSKLPKFQTIILVDLALRQILIGGLTMPIIAAQNNTHYSSRLCEQGVLTTRTTVQRSRKYHVETILFDGSRKYKFVHLLKNSKLFSLDYYQIEAILEAIDHNS